MAVIICIYKPTETEFDHNGIGVVLPTDAIVSESLNGSFELSMTCGIDNNKRILEYLTNGYIIKAPAPRGKQLFRIYNVAKKLNNTISVNARHIFYDGLNNNVENAAGSGLTADDAIKLIYRRCAVSTRFNAGSTIVSATNSININDINPVNAIFRNDSSKEGTAQGLIQLYGGELYRDNYNIVLMPAIGQERGFTIRYRKNLTGLTVSENDDNVQTRIKPFAKNADDTQLFLPEVYIDSPHIGLYFMPKINVLECRDIQVGKDGMTVSRAYEEMRAQVAKLYNDGADLPEVNAKVDFVLLSETENYKEFAPLEVIELGDVINVIHEGLGVKLKAKCIKYSYDSLLKRYKVIELGSFKEEITKNIDKNVAVASAVDTNLVSHINNLVAHLTQLEHDWLKAAIEKYPVD